MRAEISKHPDNRQGFIFFYQYLVQNHMPELKGFLKETYTKLGYDFERIEKMDVPDVISLCVYNTNDGVDMFIEYDDVDEELIMTFTKHHEKISELKIKDEIFKKVFYYKDEDTPNS